MQRPAHATLIPLQLNDEFQRKLHTQPRTWLVTGAAGFIGSNLVEALLQHNQWVRGLDDFSTGKQENLDQIADSLPPEQWSRFSCMRGDICKLEACREALKGADVVVHLAALGSVPRSIEDPAATNAANVHGFLNMLLAAREANVTRFVYASSSSVYGDSRHMPKREELIGRPLSPYAVSKYADELYAQTCGSLYSLQTVGLRFFNVFGPRQDPNGAYAAVIPRWVQACLQGRPCIIFGDGRTSRDFCYVANVLQAIICSATTENPAAFNQVFNVGCGRQSSLLEMHEILRTLFNRRFSTLIEAPRFASPRNGDVAHSLADIRLIQRELGYKPAVQLAEGLAATVDWFLAHRHPAQHETTSAPLPGFTPSDAKAEQRSARTDY